MIPPSIRQKCSEILGADVVSVRPVAGGDINQAMLLDTVIGQFFLKVNLGPMAISMFETEASGLELLAATKTIRTPSVLGFGSSSEEAFLLLEYVQSGYRPSNFWEKFGASLASLHRSTAPSFGLGNDNFIGTLRQQNCQHSTWPEFYINERLLPQLEIAKQQNCLHSDDFQAFEKLFKRIPELCPEESPSLTHGDLWSGNFLCNNLGNPVIFDPAISYAHREMDLAMSRLFGGFDRTFYSSYEAVWPLVPGFEQRLEIYQLYYLLVHVNLFGGGYVGSVRSILKAFI